MNQSNTRVPDWMIERLARSDLDDARAAELRRHLDASPDGAARLKAIVDSDREILEQHPPARVAAEIERRLETAKAAPSRSTWRWPALALPVAAGAVAVLMIFSRPLVTPDTTTAEDDVIRLKGDPGLRLFRRQGDQVQRLKDGAAAQAHDVLQLGYLAGSTRYGAVLSIDGNQHVTWHLPEQPGVAELQSSKMITLPHSYELDDAPGFERFVFITSDRPFDAKTALEVLRSAVPPASFKVAQLTLKKEQKP